MPLSTPSQPRASDDAPASRRVVAFFTASIVLGAPTATVSILHVRMELPFAVSPVTGQRWGNPLYDWRRLEDEGFAWWRDRLRANLERADWVRLDHFRGFAAYWEVPAEEPTAVNGRWVDGPGRALFDALASELGADLPLIAEDLGVITPEVDALRDGLRLPGMKVLQFAFGEDDSPHAPHRHTARAVVYSGTHDNDTAAGWYGALGEAERKEVDEYLGRGEPIAVRLVRAAFTSVADHP